MDRLMKFMTSNKLRQLFCIDKELSTWPSVF